MVVSSVNNGNRGLLNLELFLDEVDDFCFEAGVVEAVDLLEIGGRNTYFYFLKNLATMS